MARKDRHIMATDLTLYLDDQPGELAGWATCLARQAPTSPACVRSHWRRAGRGDILVQDATSAFEALQDAGIRSPPSRK